MGARENRSSQIAEWDEANVAGADFAEAFAYGSAIRDSEFLKGILKSVTPNDHTKEDPR
jgi:hypothetical protein